MFCCFVGGDWWEFGGDVGEFDIGVLVVKGVWCVVVYVVYQWQGEGVGQLVIQWVVVWIFDVGQWIVKGDYLCWMNLMD